MIRSEKAVAHAEHFLTRLETARGAPEQFYLPRTVLSEVRQTWEPGDTLALLNPIMELEKARRVPNTRTNPKIGRNAPCPCGSGKKHKKCCDGGSARAPVRSEGIVDERSRTADIDDHNRLT